MGNNIRTIEMWFRSKNEINSSNSDFISLVARNNGLRLNEDEFDVSFSPVSGSQGKLRFRIDDSAGNEYAVYSDKNSWSANQWYHLAAVVDSANGMMLFIDGKKQMNINSYNSATGSVNKITAIGKWGDLDIRYFEGDIDDLRFSSTAVYSSNFTPPCSKLSLLGSTVGLWDFEETGNVAIDSSTNKYNGQIYGAQRTTVEICDSLTVSTDKHSGNSVNIYPNPAQDYFNVVINQNVFTIMVLDVKGLVVHNEVVNDSMQSIDVSTWSAGIYFLQLLKDNVSIDVRKLVINK